MKVTATRRDIPAFTRTSCRILRGLIGSGFRDDGVKDGCNLGCDGWTEKPGEERL
jgi:hypothetical protein